MILWSGKEKLPIVFCTKSASTSKNILSHQVYEKNGVKPLKKRIFEPFLKITIDKPNVRKTFKTIQIKA